MSNLIENSDEIKTQRVVRATALRRAVDSGSTRAIASALHAHPVSKMAPWERRVRLFRLSNGALPAASEADDLREAARNILALEECGR